MSGAATTAFDEAFDRASSRKCVAMVEITFPSATVLRAATDGVMAGGYFWEPLLSEGTITCPGSYCGTDVELVSADFTLLDRDLSLSGGGSLSLLLATERLVGALVTIWFWERTLDFATNALQRFSGVVQAYGVKTNEVVVTCLQGRSWNKPLLTRRVTRDEYKQATEGVVGQPLGVVLGRVSGLGMRFPWPTEYGADQNAREHYAGGHRVSKAMLVDAGCGGTVKAKVVVAGHQLKQLGAYMVPGGVGVNYGASLFFEVESGGKHLIELATSEVFNTTTEAGFTIPDNGLFAWYPLSPSDVLVSAGSAINPRAILDPNDETTWARLDSTHTHLDPVFPALPTNIGSPVSSTFYLLYRSSSTMTGARARLGPLGTLVPTTIPVSTTPTAWSVVLGTAIWPTLGYGTCVIDGITAGTLDVFGCGWAIKYAVPEEFISVLKTTEMVPVPRRNVPGERPSQDTPTTYRERQIRTNVTEVRGKFYVNAQGWPDDVASTYSSENPGTYPLIERFPDLTRLVLEQFAGGQSVELAGGLGDFISARNDLKTWRGTDMVGGYSPDENVDVRTALGHFMEASASQVYLDEFTGTWRFIPWKLNPTVTYARPISKFDLLDPDTCVGVEMSPDSDVVVGVRVNYGYDSASGGPLHESSVTQDSSIAGHAFRNIRDERIEIIASQNDRLDFRRGTFLPTVATNATYSAVLTPQAFTDPMACAQHVATQMNAIDPTACFYQCGYGGTIVTGYNDTLDFNDGAVKSITVPAVPYTMVTLCSTIQTLLNAASGGWSCRYLTDSRKVFFSQGININFPASLGVNAAKSVLPVLGFENGWRGTGNVALGGVTNLTGQYKREDEQFYIASTNTWLDLLFYTGTFGTSQATIREFAEPMGFDMRNDLAAGNDTSHLGSCPKNVREYLLEVASNLYGSKSELPVDGRAIYDTTTARERRNRAVTLQGFPLPRVRFTAYNHAGLRRGDVFKFKSDINDLRAYPVPGSGGDWTTRVFRVLELHPAFGSSFHNEVVAVDLTA